MSGREPISEEDRCIFRPETIPDRQQRQTFSAVNREKGILKLE